MLALTCHIEIGKYQFSYTAEVAIHSSWRTLTDTASVKLPNYKANKLDDAIQIGDPVKIALGYNGTDKLKTEFEGYVTEKRPNLPFEISCEDMMFLLKREKLPNETLEKPTIEKVINHIIEPLNKKREATKKIRILTDGAFITTAIESFKFENDSPASALQALKDKYGLAIYFRKNELYVGFAYGETNLTSRPPENYHLQKNIVSTRLTYKEKTNDIINVKAVSTLEDATVLEANAVDGDVDGYTEVLRFYQIDDRKRLAELASEHLGRIKYEGYEGTITTFGIPHVQHGHKAAIKDEAYPARAGTYYIDDVDTTFGTGGFRRTIRLGRKE